MLPSNLLSPTTPFVPISTQAHRQRYDLLSLVVVNSSQQADKSAFRCSLPCLVFAPSLSFSLSSTVLEHCTAYPSGATASAASSPRTVPSRGCARRTPKMLCCCGAWFPAAVRHGLSSGPPCRSCSTRGQPLRATRCPACTNSGGQHTPTPRTVSALSSMFFSSVILLLPT